MVMTAIAQCGNEDEPPLPFCRLLGPVPLGFAADDDAAIADDSEASDDDEAAEAEDMEASTDEGNVVSKIRVRQWGTQRKYITYGWR